jgi:two-component system response regulator NreC
VTQLTDREIEVLKLVAEGFSNGEIGERLFLSPKTIDSHRTNLMKKLEVHNVVELVRYAIKNKIVKLD